MAIVSASGYVRGCLKAVSTRRRGNSVLAALEFKEDPRAKAHHWAFCLMSNLICRQIVVTIALTFKQRIPNRMSHPIAFDLISHNTVNGFICISFRL